MRKRKRTKPIEDRFMRHVNQATGELNVAALEFTTQDIREGLIPFLVDHPTIHSLKAFFGKCLITDEISNDYCVASRTDLQTFTRLTTLTSLAITWSGLDSLDASILAKHPTLTALDLSYNQIEDEGAKALAANPNLLSLNLSWNEISQSGAEVFTNNRFTFFDISHNPMGLIEKKPDEKTVNNMQNRQSH